MNKPTDTFALLKVDAVGQDKEGGPHVELAVVLTGTREQVAIAARWLGMSVALSGSGDLLNAYRREASEDAKTITRLRLELEAERASVRQMTEAMAEARRTLDAMQTLLGRTAATGEA